MHKAITIIQLKVEAQIIKEHPEYSMDDRLLLHKINFEDKTVQCDGNIFHLLDDDFPTLDKTNPYKLTDEEADVMEKITYSFKNSEKLQQHSRFLFNKGGMYKIFNSKLLFHGCIPLNEDGSFREVCIDNNFYRGRALLDAIEARIRRGYYAKENTVQRKNAQDLMWYLWCGEDSPLYGKNKMTTFERYFLKEKEAQKEKYDNYYALRDNEQICKYILSEFMLDENNAHIVNGHVPVKVSKGENPVKANGRLIVIDGGFAKAYQKVTGIAGYTLISNSQGLLLASHEPFVTGENAIEREIDIITNTDYIERYPVRRKVLDTDVGRDIKAKIDDLKALLLAYSDGDIKEKQ